MKLTPTKFVFGLLLILPFLAIGQVSHSSVKKELRKLDGNQYVSTAIKGAQALMEQKEYKNALDLLDKSVKEAKSMGAGPLSVVRFNKAKLLAEEFPKDNAFVDEFIETIEDLVEKDPSLEFLEKSKRLINGIEPLSNSKTDKNLKALLTQVDDLISKEEAMMIAAGKENELKEFKKLNKEEAFGEIEKLKAERVRLEALQQRLSSSIQENEKLLVRRSSVINRMSKEQAKKEAIIQYNQRIIDSLNFTAELDSMELLSSQRRIEEQEARLELQTSKLELQESQILLKDSEIELKGSQQKVLYVAALLGLVVMGFLSWMAFTTKKTFKKLQAKNAIIEEEKERSEKLLLNILPQFIANELKESSVVKTRMISQCTVLFTDFVNFSQISKMLSPQDLIAALDECFRAFDEIVSKYDIEKIKTIGDAYMCAGGVPQANKTHAVDAVNAAYEMVEFLDEWNDKRQKENKVRFEARIGIHTGPIIAGVVGAKKFAYDIWGDTVNVAARMESQSMAKKINISDATYELVKDHYQCIKRGSISVKNMSDLEMYFVDSRLN